MKTNAPSSKPERYPRFAATSLTDTEAVNTWSLIPAGVRVSETKTKWVSAQNWVPSGRGRYSVRDFILRSDSRQIPSTWTPISRDRVVEKTAGLKPAMGPRRYDLPEIPGDKLWRVESGELYRRAARPQRAARFRPLAFTLALLRYSPD